MQRFDFLGPAFDAELTYSPRDVIDPRISVPAQHALVRLSKSPQTNEAATGLLQEIKQGRLAGILCVNWKASAQRALKLGSAWWTVIPRGEDSVLMLDAADPARGQPLIAFRRELHPDCGLLKNEKRFAGSPQRLDATLVKAWTAYQLWQRGGANKCTGAGRLLTRAPLQYCKGDVPSACSVFLAERKSANYEDFVAAPTTGRVSTFINGHNSNGPNPGIDVEEAFVSMQKTVELLKPNDLIYLAAWHFDPRVKLLDKSPFAGVTDWGGLFATSARRGVKIRILMTDFDPIAPHLRDQVHKHFLPALDAHIKTLPRKAQDNLKYVVSSHPAIAAIPRLNPPRIERVRVGTHHQKFLLTRRGPATTVHCGGLDIAPIRTHIDWTFPWHDLHLRLDGLITRDVEREFVMRWNRERSASTVVPRIPGWRGFEKLVQPPCSRADAARDANASKVQMLRTVSFNSSSPLGIQDTKRDDIWQGHVRLVGCARRFIYIEQQYCRDVRLADEIVAQAQREKDLVVVIVVPAQLDDVEDELTEHGKALQFEFFKRLSAALPPARLGVFTMFRRIIHSKLLLVDDAAMTVGSANANPRSFLLDSELNIQIGDAGVTRAFREWLWSHNLGERQDKVAAWAPAVFLDNWRRIAKANEARTGKPETMSGEGVVRFDPSSIPGKRSSRIPDVVTEIENPRLPRTPR